MPFRASGRQELCGESVRQFRELGDRHYALRAVCWLCQAHYEGGDLERTRELCEEIVREARLQHDPFPEGVALSLLADTALDQGRVEDAVSPAESSYRIFRDLGDLLNIAECVCSFARVLALVGKAEAAARVLASSAAMLDDVGESPFLRARARRRSLPSLTSSTKPPSPMRGSKVGR